MTNATFRPNEISGLVESLEPAVRAATLAWPPCIHLFGGCTTNCTSCQLLPLPSHLAIRKRWPGMGEKSHTFSLPFARHRDHPAKR